MGTGMGKTRRDEFEVEFELGSELFPMGPPSIAVELSFGGGSPCARRI